MFNVFISFIAFILAISVLVAFHEYGHFWVARKLGVKVLRFSIGFGTVLWSRTATDGVEYCICAIPLGGYVKLLGEKGDELSPEDRPHALSEQSVLKRLAIVAAGPLANFLLAWIFIFIISQVGMTGMAPIVGEIMPNTPAIESGLRVHDEIISVGGVKTPTIESVVRQVIKYIDSESMIMGVIHQDTPRTVTIGIPPMSVEADKQKNVLKRLGFDLTVPARIGAVQPDSPAAKAGLQTGDMITAVSGVPVKHWSDMVEQISAQPNKTLMLSLIRHHHAIERSIIPATKADGKGYIGITLDESLIRHSRSDVLDGLAYASSQTWNYSLLTVKMLYYVVTGRASLDNISGPVTIAQVAGASIQIGLVYFLDFLAIVSIGLGVINLLPIPILDGGHLLFYMIEGIRGKPLSDNVQNIGFRIGLLILVSLMFLAFYNDIVRLTVS